MQLAYLLRTIVSRCVRAPRSSPPSHAASAAFCSAPASTVIPIVPQTCLTAPRADTTRRKAPPLPPPHCSAQTPALVAARGAQGALITNRSCMTKPFYLYCTLTRNDLGDVRHADGVVSIIALPSAEIRTVSAEGTYEAM